MNLSADARHPKVSITVLTATLDAATVIGRLGSDLCAQTDGDFTWLLVDGGSRDGTLSALPASLRERIVLIEEQDFGIYDALNKGLRRCNTSHYLVIGADDRLDPDAISQFRRLAQIHDADIVACSVRDGARIALPGRGMPWLRGQNAFISHHSAGTLIRRELHDRFGFYSAALPIAADHLFIKTAISGGARLHCASDYIAGEFSRDGVSSRRYTATLFEFTLVQLRTERWRSLQLILFLLRLLVHWAKVVQ